jgi:hypothetical protein
VSQAFDFLVRRDDLHICKVVAGEGSKEDLEEDQVQLRIEKFALTANNVTYAVYGDAIGYWRFFPAEEGWGRPPVWGFGKVVKSNHDAVPVGERYYGFFPISSFVTIDAKPNSAGMRDVAAHRAELPSAYNQYFSVSKDPVYDAAHENEQMILRPLFVTSFLACDFLQDKSFKGAVAIILSSASSKTAYGIASLLSKVPGIEVWALTSARNEGFTIGLGCYDRVFTYDHVDEIPNDRLVAYVDVAGSVAHRKALHQKLGSQLIYSMALGDTHWDEYKEPASLASDQEFFFAPTWLKKRTKDWGIDGYVERLASAWRTFSESLTGWMKVVQEAGPEAIERVWLDHVDGKADPATGNVLSMD